VAPVGRLAGKACQVGCLLGECASSWRASFSLARAKWPIIVALALGCYHLASLASLADF